MEDLRHAIVEGLKRSRKYQDLCDPVLERIAAWAAARHAAPRQAIHAAKRKLHQVYGAYAARMNLARIAQLVGALSPADSDERRKQVCARILDAHASTRERQPFLDRLYPALRAALGVPRSILDLACGLHPFGLPWMDLPLETEYYALDISRGLVTLLNQFFVAAGRRPNAACHDLLTDAPLRSADVALLFKLLPLLERQEPGTAAALLRRLPARAAVVSFPARSLSGGEKGMRAHYAAFMADLARELGLSPQTLEFETETFYLLRLQ